jgi:hypothetical protein
LLPDLADSVLWLKATHPLRWIALGLEIISLAALLRPWTVGLKVLRAHLEEKEMSIIAKDSKKEFTPAPEGLWPAVCCDVLDLGEQESQWGKKHRVEIRWLLEEKDDETDKPYMVIKRFTLSLHEKATLRSTLEAWRGRKFSKEELEGFDLEKLVSANCQIQIIHNLGGDGTVYANVQAVVPAAKNSTKLRVNGDYVRVCDREKRAELERNPDGGYKAADEDVPF